MKRLTSTTISELLQFLNFNEEDDYIEVEIYSFKTYANCDKNLMIASFVSLDRIGAYLLVQKIKAFKITTIGAVTRLTIICNEI